MKTLLKNIGTLALCAVSTLAMGLRPATTFTLVDPCARFATVTAVAGAHNCYSLSVTNPDPGDPDLYYTWSFGDGQTAHGRALVHCYSATLTGNYPVTLNYNSPACQQQPYSPVYTASLSPATVTDCTSDANYTLSAQSLTMCCLYAGPVIPEMMYAFDYGDGAPVTQNKIHTYTACGSYIVKTHSYDMNLPNAGCYSFSALNLACPQATTALHENKAAAITRIFPNPAQQVLRVSSDQGIRTLRVSDLSGRALHEKQLSLYNKEMVIETGDLLPGTYLLYLQLENGAQQHLKFIKE